MQYALQYIMNLRSASGKKATLGTIVHLVLEILANAKKTNHHLLIDRYTDYRYLLKIVVDRFKREEPSLEWTDADWDFCIEQIEAVLNSPFNPLKLNIIQTEKRFQIPIQLPGFDYEYYDLLTNERTRGWIELRGTIDLLFEENPETLHILDYKTGQRKCWTTGCVKDFDYLSSDDFQLRMYDLASTILYPQYRCILLTIFFTRDGGPFTVSFDSNDRKETYQLLKQHISSVKSNSLPSRIKEVKSSQRWKCKYTCSFGSRNDNEFDMCDKIYNYMLNHGLDQTILDIEAKRAANQSSITTGNAASNRRNIY
jgi:hypothetical protein